MGLKGPKKKALVIAVSDYENLPSREQLPFCKKDGEQMIKVLENLGFKIKKKEGLIGKVNGTLMRDVINEFFEGRYIKSTDIMLFYYTGHGLPRGGQHYFSSSDIDPGMPGGRGLLFTELSGLIDRCAAKCVVAILDCCYAGAAGIVMGDATSQLENIKNNQQKDFVSQNEGRCLLAACDDNEQATPHLKQDYSFFTYYLLEALSGANGASVNEKGKLTPQSILSYVNRAIDSLTENEKPLQRPFIKNIGRDEIELAYFDEWNRLKPQATVEEQLILLLREAKIEEYQTLKKQNPERILDLDGFVFPSVELCGIDLRWASLVGVDLSGRDLSGALFSNGANLSRAILNEANLTGANFEHCNLRGTKLRKSVLDNAVLRACDLTEADCSGAIFSKSVDFNTTILNQANLEGAIFNGMSLRGKTFHGNLKDTKFIKATLMGVTFDGADLTGADFSGAITEGLRFIDCQLTKTTFNKAELKWSDFAGGPLQCDVNMHGANLLGATFNSIKISKLNLSGAILYKARFIFSTLARPDFSNAKLDGAGLRFVKWFKPILKNVNLSELSEREVTELDKDPFETWS